MPAPIQHHQKICAVLILFCLTACQVASLDVTSAKHSIQDQSRPIPAYFDLEKVSWVKSQIRFKQPYFTKQYQNLMKQAQQALAYQTDPVTNKTERPASGDKHDYLSYAPYRWPNPNTQTGLPWIARDGKINPISQGRDTDFTRSSEFFSVIESLAWAYYFSDDSRYAEKLIELISVWYLQPETRVNPNINHGQAIPGMTDGSKAGVQEWHRQSHVITALQLLELSGALPVEIKQGMQLWFNDYLTWLTTNTMAKSTGLTGQKHATLYTQQVVGLMLYLGKLKQAKAEIEAVKVSRIAAQILPNGIQPKEIGRTRSVHYVVYNTWAMTELLVMGRKLGIDLWAYESVDGRSLKKAYEFMTPFANGEKVWQHKDISAGGAEQVIKVELLPMMVKASSVLGVSLLKASQNMTNHLTPIEALTYPLADMGYKRP